MGGRVQEHHGSAAQAHARAGLPLFVGRSRELAGVAASLRTQPLVTITGPGGVGKTRLARELLRERTGEHRQVHFVDLAAIDLSVDVMSEIARAAGVAAAPERLGSALEVFLQDRRTLLVLDNCEHVLHECAVVAAKLLDAVGDLRLLVTSREPLGLPVEVVWRLGPLSDDEGYRLFIDRARRLQPGFLPDPATEQTIRRLCDRMDRLPLALEIAASQMTVMTPSEVLARIEAHLGLASVTRPLSPSRQSTLRDLIQWSYALLVPEEQAGFRGLAVFEGEFGADSALSVSLDGSIDLLAALVNKSLVAADSDGTRTRYRMLATIRQYALDELVRCKELDDTRVRQLDHYLQVGERARQAWLATGSDWLVYTLDGEYESVRAALVWSIEHDPCAGMRLFGAIRNLFFRSGQADGLRIGRRLIDACPLQEAFRVDALIGVGQLASTLMDHAAARDALAEAAALAQALDDRVRGAWVAFFQGLTEGLAGAPQVASEHLRASLAMHRELGIELGQARALAVLGVSELTRGEHGSARELLEQALALYRAQDDVWGQGQCLTFLGLITAATAVKPARATALFRQAVELLAPLRDATILPIALIGQASLLGPGERTRAVKVAAAACAERTRIGGRFPPFLAGRVADIRAAAEKMDDGAGARLWREGGQLDVQSAVALAFGTENRVPEQVADLSRRELDVVKLLSAGLANKEIAARLHLSVRTVESHVRSALGKLGLDNRTQLATWARERIQ